MAAAFRSAGTAVEAAATTLEVSYTLTSGDLLCLLLSVHDEANAPSSVVSDVDGAMELVNFEANTGVRGAALYVLENATAGAHTITVTYAGSETMAGVAFGLSGVNMTQSWDGATDAEAATGATDIDISVTSPAGDLALMVAATAESAVNLTLDNGTVHVDTNTTNFGLYVASRAGQGGATSIDGAFSANSFGWTAVGANINAAPSAAVSGTAGDGATEAEIVAGGGTIVITLTGDTWIPA